MTESVSRNEPDAGSAADVGAPISREPMAVAVWQEIVQTVREPMLVLDASLRVLAANESFYATFRVLPVETERCLIYELGNGQWDIQELRRLLDDVLPHNHVFDNFVFEHEFEEIGQRKMMLNARRIDHLNLTLLAMEDVAERQQSERHTTETTRSLERQVSRRSEAQQILHDVALASNEAATVEEALQTTLRCLCDFNHWQVGHAWRRDDDGESLVSADIWYVNESVEDTELRLEQLREITRRTSIAEGESLVGRVMATGAPQWIDDLQNWEAWDRGDAEALGLRAAIAFPVTVDGDVAAVLECFSDRPLKREDRFMEIMPDVGIQLGHLIERKRLERAVAEAAAAQQRYFAQELHDSISQELTGVSMMAGMLQKQLQDQVPEQAQLLATLIDHIREVQRQIRRLSRGLMPVEVDPHGLCHALRELAENCEQMHGVRCVADCSAAATVDHTETATEMYRIAQEALQNAVKHAEATELRITLQADDADTILTIQDNGRGLPEGGTRSAGSGQRIMRYRANLIGASLDVQSEPGQGVTVTCRLPHRS